MKTVRPVKAKAVKHVTVHNAAKPKKAKKPKLTRFGHAQ